MPTKNKAELRRRFVPEAESIWLGSGDSVKEYKVVPVAWSTLYELKDLLRELLGEVTDLWNQDILSNLKEALTTDGTEKDGGTGVLQKVLVNDNVWALINSLLEKPYKFFKLAIPDLEEVHFTAPSNPKSATIPQVWATFEVIAEVNRLDFAKNLLGSKTPPASN